jgi:hypothetical protein
MKRCHLCYTRWRTISRISLLYELRCDYSKFGFRHLDNSPNLSSIKVDLESDTQVTFQSVSTLEQSVEKKYHYEVLCSYNIESWVQVPFKKIFFIFLTVKKERKAKKAILLFFPSGFIYVEQWSTWVIPTKTQLGLTREKTHMNIKDISIFDVFFFCYDRFALISRYAL